MVLISRAVLILYADGGYEYSLLNNFYQSQAAPRIFANDSKAFLSSSSKAEITVESMSITATICILSAHHLEGFRALRRSMAKPNI